jgi:transcriptional regulator GlxA family with amidase domain
MSDPPAFVVVFALFDDLTQLDFTGPWEVLTRLPGAEVILASRDGGRIHARHGLAFEGVRRLAEIDRCDLICVPGGPGTAAAMLDEAFIAEVRRLAGGARYVTSVCTGSLILGAAGLLKGRRAACHWASRQFLEAFGAIPAKERVVVDGNIVTGGGVTAGIDFGLTIAAEVAGRAHAEYIQLSLEYAPKPPFKSGEPWTASDALVAHYLKASKAWTEERAAAVATAAARARGEQPG